MFLFQTRSMQAFLYNSQQCAHLSAEAPRHRAPRCHDSYIPPLGHCACAIELLQHTLRQGHARSLSCPTSNGHHSFHCPASASLPRFGGLSNLQILVEGRAYHPREKLKALSLFSCPPWTVHLLDSERSRDLGFILTNMVTEQQVVSRAAASCGARVQRWHPWGPDRTGH